MPVVFNPAQALELLEYGDFTLLNFTVTLDPLATITARLSVQTDKHLLTERFSWGSTKIPDQIYYELWYSFQKRGVLNEFYCGDYINESNLDNRSTHIWAADWVDVKLWNKVNVERFVDFTVWYYTYWEKNVDDVFAILKHDWNTLDKIAKYLESIDKKTPARPPARPGVGIRGVELR
ncbi:MAG: hypothetical protein QMC77_08745 [Methanocellales archaeon]|nr:hypothetical protein [Methanocellales archaeon]